MLDAFFGFDSIRDFIASFVIYLAFLFDSLTILVKF
jgi:hypothetical protein